MEKSIALEPLYAHVRHVRERTRCRAHLLGFEPPTLFIEVSDLNHSNSNRSFRAAVVKVTRFHKWSGRFKPQQVHAAPSPFPHVADVGVKSFEDDRLPRAGGEGAATIVGKSLVSHNRHKDGCIGVKSLAGLLGHAS